MPQAFIAFLLLSAFLGVSMAATRTEFVSANHQSFVQLELGSTENKILVTVFHLTNEVKTLHWSRAVNWEQRHPSSASQNLDEVKALGRNVGSTPGSRGGRAAFSSRTWC